MSLFDDASLVLTPNGYKASKLYSIKPTSGLGDMTVVRATTATRVNSSGLIESVAINVPRLDYPLLGGCPSILVEPLRTNLVLRSEEFDNAYWTKVQGGIALAPVVTPNVETAPDGTMTADRVVFNLNGGTASGDLSSLGSANFTSISITRTQSVWIKTTDGTTKVFTFVSPTGAATTITVTSVYQRFTWTSTGINVSSVRLRLRGSASGEGTATSASIAIWGAQMEDGSNATSYIPTVAGTVTRVADVISKTGVSSLIGQTEGTLFVDVNFEAESFAKYYLTLGNSGSFNIAISAKANNKIGMEVFNTTGQVNASSTSTYTTNQRLKIAMTYKLNDFNLYVNGVLQATDTVGTVPTTGVVILGSTATSTFQATDGINLASIFTTALSPAQCIDLTN